MKTVRQQVVEVLQIREDYYSDGNVEAVDKTDFNYCIYFVQRLGFDTVKRAMEYTCYKVQDDYDGQWRYFAKICHAELKKL